MGIPGAVFANRSHPAPSLVAAHELWHVLSKSDPVAAGKFGRLIEESIPPLMLESAISSYETKYGPDAMHEVASNLFASAVNSAGFSQLMKKGCFLRKIAGRKPKKISRYSSLIPQIV